MNAGRDVFRDTIDLAGDCVLRFEEYDISPFTSFHDFKIAKVSNYPELTIKALQQLLTDTHVKLISAKQQLDSDLSGLQVDAAPEDPMSQELMNISYDTLLTRLFYAIPEKCRLS